MKILVLVNLDNYLYNFRKELLQALLEQGHSIWASLPAGDYAKKLTDMGCHIIDTALVRRSMNPLKDLRLMRQYSKIIKKVKPDAVLTYTTKPNIYGGIVCRYHKVPYICNITGLGTAVENKGILQKLTLAMYKTAMKRAQRVFFQNRENSELFVRKGIVRQNYTLLPGSGVNLSEYTPLPYENSGTVNFLFSSRILKEKGIDQYLDAAQEITKEYPDTKFCIIGFCEQEYDKRRLEECHKTGIVEYCGMQSDVISFYNKAHCVVHPTYYPEGISNVLLEGAACARPLISTDRSGCREVINDRETGYLVQPKNSEDLIDKIKQFLALSFEQKREMGLAGRRKVEREFDRQIVVNAYIDEIRKCNEYHGEALR